MRLRHVLAVLAVVTATAVPARPAGALAAGTLATAQVGHAFISPALEPLSLVTSLHDWRIQTLVGVGAAAGVWDNADAEASLPAANCVLNGDTVEIGIVTGAGTFNAVCATGPVGTAVTACGNLGYTRLGGTIFMSGFDTCRTLYGAPTRFQVGDPGTTTVVVFHLLPGAVVGGAQFLVAGGFVFAGVSP